MSSINVDISTSTLAFDAAEEFWFNDYGRRKLPLRLSPMTPPAPIGDPLADSWFR